MIDLGLKSPRPRLRAEAVSLSTSCQSPRMSLVAWPYLIEYWSVLISLPHSICYFGKTTKGSQGGNGLVFYVWFDNIVPYFLLPLAKIAYRQHNILAPSGTQGVTISVCLSVCLLVQNKVTLCLHLLDSESIYSFQ